VASGGLKVSELSLSPPIIQRHLKIFQMYLQAIDLGQLTLFKVNVTSMTLKVEVIA